MFVENNGESNMIRVKYQPGEKNEIEHKERFSKSRSDC